MGVPGPGAGGLMDTGRENPSRMWLHFLELLKRGLVTGKLAN